MDNTIRIAIPWKPGMTVMLKDGRSEPDEIAGGFILRPNNTNRKEH